MARTKAKRKSTDSDHADDSYPHKRVRATGTDAAATTATPRSSARRKAAKTTLSKLKEIAQDEEAFSDEEQEAVEPVGAPEINVKQVEAQSLVDVENLPVVAPGFRLWDTESTLLARKGETLKVTEVGKSERDFSRVLDVHYPELFKLVPLVVTQGPYQGRHVFMLEPDVAGFPFLKLPAELRILVYSFVFGGEERVRIGSIKQTNEPKRAVRASLEGLPFRDSYRRKRDDRARVDALSPVQKLLTLSKQVLEEAAPVIYSDRYFRFIDTRVFKIWLNSIGDMRRLVRHVHVGDDGYGGWHRTSAGCVVTKLKDATDLRSFSIIHSNICGNGGRYMRWRTHTSNFAYQISRIWARNKDKIANPADLLDIIKVKWERCKVCAPLAPAFPETESTCRNIDGPHWLSPPCATSCEKAAKHCLKVQRELRKLVAKELHIEDPLAPSDDEEVAEDDPAALAATEVK